MRLGKDEQVVLPYYAYFPPFLLEEETCEGLYFSGNIVDYRQDSKNITFFIGSGFFLWRSPLWLEGGPRGGPPG